MTELVAAWVGSAVEIGPAAEILHKELGMCLVSEEVEPEQAHRYRVTAERRRPRLQREMMRRAPGGKGALQADRWKKLAHKKAGGAVLAHINSLEDKGADDAFAASGVQKPKHVRDLLVEEVQGDPDAFCLFCLLHYDEVTEEEAMEAFHEQGHDCMEQCKAFISFFQVSSLLGATYHIPWPV